MTRKFLTPALLTLAGAALALGACKAADTPSPAAKSNDNAAAHTSAPGTTTVDADAVRRVSVAELQKMVEEGAVAVYDTRAKAQYEQEHIKGALSLPQNEAESRAAELPRDKTLVFYCT